MHASKLKEFSTGGQGAECPPSKKKLPKKIEGKIGKNLDKIGKRGKNREEKLGRKGKNC